MADLMGVALSVSTTLLLQGVYFVVLEYPEKLRTEQFSMEADHRKQLDRFANVQDALIVCESATDQMRDFNQKIFSRQDGVSVAAVRDGMRTVLAQLRGLEVTAQPFASNIAKQISMLSRTLELAMVWTGEPSAGAQDELHYMLPTLLYSAKAVKQANDQDLAEFWTEMSVRAAALRALIRKYVASSIGLAAAAFVLLSLSVHALRQQNLLGTGGASVCWVAGIAFASYAAFEVMRRVRRVAASAGNVEENVQKNQRSLPKYVDEVFSAKVQPAQTDSGEIVPS